MEQFQQLRQKFYSLPVREQWMLSGTLLLIFITLFYLVVWEPVKNGLQDEIQKQQSQQDILVWMQDAEAEVRQLRTSGRGGVLRDRHKPVNLVVETSLTNAGLKSSLKKIESSGSKGTRVTLSDASFNQMLIWLNTLATFNGIHVVSATIERSATPGKTNARLTFERP